MLMKNDNLMQTLLERRSIRRYQPRPLNNNDRQTVDKIIKNSKALQPSIITSINIHEINPQINLVSLLGAYGRLVSPPYILLPTTPDDPSALINQGYQMQQIVIHLYQQGIGSCYLGALGSFDRLREQFSLPENVSVGALLAFGYPADSLPGRTFNTLFRSAIGSSRRLPVEKVFFETSFDNPSLPPTNLRSIIDAGRMSPSAVNAQPWRFFHDRDALVLYRKRNNPKYGLSGQDYALFDCGICMANIQLALQAADMPGKWHLLDDDSRVKYDTNPDLIPLAKLVL